jgi:serine/threonine protein phosphatase PrpC
LKFLDFPKIRTLDIADTHIEMVGAIPKDLKELSVSNATFFRRMNNPVVRLYQGRSVGYSEIMGARPTMEDSIIVRSEFVPHLDLYAVIDGHGGSVTADIAAFMIPDLFHNLERKSIADFASVFRKLHEYLRLKKIRDGAAIVVALKTPADIGIAYVGDSRALIVNKNFSVTALTIDHKPVERGELGLIKENHSFVEDARTAGILAVSRSLGDFGIPGVSHVPSVAKYKRKKTDWRLVLACDGVFDVIDNDEVGRIIEGENDVRRAACVLRNVAEARASRDKVSVIVVDIEL